MYCGQCGKQNPDPAAFCIYCGSPLGAAAKGAVGAVPPPSPAPAPWIPPVRVRRRPMPAWVRPVLCLLVLVCVGGAMFVWVFMSARQRRARVGKELQAAQAAVATDTPEAIRRFTLAGQDPEVRDEAVSWLLNRTVLQQASDRRQALRILDVALPDWPRSAAAAGVVPTLVRSLSSPEPWVRLDAARVLGRIGDRRAIEPLLTAILPAGRTGNRNDPWIPHRYRDDLSTAEIRQVLLEALTAIDANWYESVEARAVVPDFIAALKLTTLVARGAAADWLGLLRDRRAIRPLLVARLDWVARSNESHWHDPVDLDELIMRSLSQIDPKWAESAEAKAAIPRYVAAMSDAERSVRTVAVKGVRRFGGPEMIGPLLLARLREPEGGYNRPPYEKALSAADPNWASSKAAKAVVLVCIAALRDESYEVRLRAILGLGDIGDARAVVPLLRRMVEKPHLHYCDGVYESLAKIDPKWTQRSELLDVLPALGKALRGRDEELCGNAERVLEKIADIEMLTPDIYLSLSPKSPRRAAADLLTPHYFEELKAKSEWPAGEEIAAIGDPRYVPRVVMVARRQQGTRISDGNAARILKRMHAASKKPLLLSLLYANEDQRYQVQRELEFVLGEDWRRAAKEISGVLNRFIAALKDSDVHVRRRAAFWLGGFGRSEAVKPLIEALRREKESAVVSAVQTALRRFNSAGTISALEAMSKDADATTRQRIRKVLDRLRSANR